MKKIFKIIPLFVLPLVLASCDLNMFKGHVEGDDTQTTDDGGSGDTVYAETLSIAGPNTIVKGNSNKVTLTATITPTNATNKKITWSSSDESKATVSSSGTVTGKAVGPVTITASVAGKDGAITAEHPMTVTYADVISVTLSDSSKNLAYGASVNLTATLNKSGDQNFDQNTVINWSTSNSSVASLNTTTTKSGQSVTVTAGSSTANATIIASVGSINATCTISVSDNPMDKWTIMIYMCGADLESGYDYYSGTFDNPTPGYASTDISEILSVNGQPDDVNIILETGGARKWKNSKIQSVWNQGKLGRWHVANKQLVADTHVDYENGMGESETFQDFLEWGLTNYPAEKTGVILWNHGGAMQGVCQDETPTGGYDMLDNKEVKDALSAAFTATGTSKLEWIGYDACLMAVQDIAEFNSQYFNYMVCSEESEAGYGWEYNTWVDDLYAKNSTTTILEAICDRFVAQSGATGNDQTLSVLDLSKMAAYKTAFEDFASSVGSCISSYGKSNFQNFMKHNVKYFSTYQYTYEQCYADLEDWASSNDMTVSQILSYLGYSSAHELFVDEDGDYGWGLSYENGLYCDWTGERFALFDIKDFFNKISTLSQFQGSTIAGKITTAKNALSQLVIYSVDGDAAGEAYGLALFFSLVSSAYRTSVYTSSQTNFSNWRSVVNSYGV